MQPDSAVHNRMEHHLLETAHKVEETFIWPSFEQIAFAFESFIYSKGEQKHANHE